VRVYLHGLVLAQNQHELGELAGWARAHDLPLALGLPRQKSGHLPERYDPDPARLAALCAEAHVVGAPPCLGGARAPAPDPGLLDRAGPFAVYAAIQAGDFAAPCDACAERPACLGLPRGVARAWAGALRPRGPAARVERGHRVRWSEVLAYASQFAELDIVRAIDPSAPSARIDVPAGALRARRPRGRAVARFGPLDRGARLGDWRVDLVAVADDAVRVLLVRREEEPVVLALATAPGPSGPFDIPPVRITYERTAAPFASFEPAGRALRDLLAAAAAPGSIAEAFPRWARDAPPAPVRTRALPDAETVDVRPDGKVYLRVTDACQERCLFCFFYDNPAVDNLVRDHDLDAVIGGLDPATVTQVVLTGGEPTLHPRFGDYLRALHGRGFRQIIVQTNGVRLAEPGALEALLPFADRLGLGFSLHAASAATNDALTTVAKGFFPLKLAAIRRAAALDLRTKITLVLSRHNLGELVAFVDLCHELTAGRGAFLQMSLPSFEGRMNLFVDTYPRLAEIAAALPPALRRARELGLPLALCHQCQVPPCIVPDDVQHLESLWFEHTPAMWEHDRAYGEACARCAMRPWCSGVWAGYAARFGTAELRPFAPEEVEPR
jgi:MoaA/NifB/PqqE/SkfB family radical SAM enzyme